MSSQNHRLEKAIKEVAGKVVIIFWISFYLPFEQYYQCPTYYYSHVCLAAMVKGQTKRAADDCNQVQAKQ
jgi:hypothetical protein